MKLKNLNVSYMENCSIDMQQKISDMEIYNPELEFRDQEDVIKIFVMPSAISNDITNSNENSTVEIGFIDIRKFSIEELKNLAEEIEKIKLEFNTAYEALNWKNNKDTILYVLNSNYKTILNERSDLWEKRVKMYITIGFEDLKGIWHNKEDRIEYA